jgi:predicted DNA binding CopG/RHH family protein
MKRVNVYLPEDLLERLQQQADYEGIARSGPIKPAQNYNS